MSETALMAAIDNYKENDEIPEILEEFLVQIAKSGFVPTTWEKLQKLFLSKLNKVVEDFYKGTPFQPKQVNKHCEEDNFEEMKNRLNELVLNFDEPPFTIQRLCELLTQPKKNYTKCDKFMRGMEKNLMVVSSWKRVSNYTNNLPKISMNGMMPNCIDHTSIPSPVSTNPPKLEGSFFPMEVVQEGATQSTSQQQAKQSLLPPTMTNVTPNDPKDNIEVESHSTAPPSTATVDKKLETETAEVEASTEPKPQLLGKRKSESDESLGGDIKLNTNDPQVPDSSTDVSSTKKLKTDVEKESNDDSVSSDVTLQTATATNPGNMSTKNEE